MADRQLNAGKRSLRLLRNTSFGFLALMMLQFWLGMTVNLEVNLPVKHLNVPSSLSYYGGFSPYVLAHIVNGVMLLLLSMMLVALSVRSNYRSLRITSLIAFLAVIGAVINGVLFLTSGQFFGWSVGMAMSAFSATFSVAIGLYFTGYYFDSER